MIHSSLPELRLTTDTSAGTRSVDRVQGGGSSPGASGKSGDSTDEVSLSSLASQLQGLQPDSEQRLGRVDALREAVASGRYSPDPAAVAGSIISEALVD
jgi:flagellar biosynthesis anti-sigma factor FlgM